MCPFSSLVSNVLIQVWIRRPRLYAFPWGSSQGRVELCVLGLYAGCPTHLHFKWSSWWVWLISLLSTGKPGHQMCWFCLSQLFIRTSIALTFHQVPEPQRSTSFTFVLNKFSFVFRWTPLSPRWAWGWQTRNLPWLFLPWHLCSL